MDLKGSIKISITALKANKSRSFLTILGIVIGVGAVIIMMSLGKGAQSLILGQVQIMGAKTIAVMPGRQPEGLTDVLTIFSDSLKQKDVDALLKKSNVPHLSQIMPVVFGSEMASYGNETFRPTIFGVSNLFAEIYDIYPEFGRLFTGDEIKNYADVVIIGSKVKDELFGNEEALNQKIRIKDRKFKVIGILPKKGQFSFLNFDEAAVIPYTTAQQYIFGIKYFHRLVVEADSEITVDETVEDIKLTLRNSHGITDPSKDDFFVETQAGAMEQVSTIMNVLTYFLAAVASIALIVGGVGIMNIMLVSVTERTREIGLRKAVGARNKDILNQFLIESVTLTVLGGIVGFVGGVLISFVASIGLSKVLNTGWSFVLPFGAVILAFGVAALVGLIFGIYPARKAAKLNPIEALRHE